MNSLFSFFNDLVPVQGSFSAGTERYSISGGKKGTAETIAKMQELVTEGKRERKVRMALHDIIKGCTPKDYLCYARSAYTFCRDKITYVFDPAGVELIENPKYILETKVADCDSICVLLATLCEQMGFPCRFVTIKADLSRPDEYSHVYMQANIPKHGWVSMDCTMPNKEFGWEPDKQFPRTYWPASKDAPESHEGDKMAGLGIVPGAAETPGLQVTPLWAWQQDGNLFPATPDEADDAIFAEEHMPEFSGVPIGGVSGLGSMGMDGVVDQASAAYDVISKILSGTLFDSLLKDRDDALKQQQDFVKVEAAFNAMPAGAAKSAKAQQVAAARSALQATVNSVNSAFKLYNEILGKVNSMAGLVGASPFRTLPATGLGAVPLIAAAVYGAIGVATLYGLSTLIDSIRGNAARSKSLIEQASEGITSIGNTAESLAKAALIGAVVYVGFSFLKKTGRI